MLLESRSGVHFCFVIFLGFSLISHVSFLCCFRWSAEKAQREGALWRRLGDFRPFQHMPTILYRSVETNPEITNPFCFCSCVFFFVQVRLIFVQKTSVVKRAISTHANALLHINRKCVACLNQTRSHVHFCPRTGWSTYHRAWHRMCVIFWKLETGLPPLVGNSHAPLRPNAYTSSRAVHFVEHWIQKVATFPLRTLVLGVAYFLRPVGQHESDVSNRLET